MKKVEKHSPSNCPFLHVKKCKGCGRSCDCYKKRPKKLKPKCTCDRRGKDMDKDEHFITCPVILTPEVLSLLGLVVRERKGAENGSKKIHSRSRRPASNRKKKS